MAEEGDKTSAGDGFWQKLRNAEYRRKCVYSVALCASMLALGLRTYQNPAAFMDLAQITGSNVEEASLFYTSIAAGSLAGAVSMGFLFGKQRRLLLMVIASTGATVTVIAVPWSSNYYLTISLFFVNFVFNGALDAGVNSEMFSTWGIEGKMFVQFLHFSFTIGTLISPLTVQPFLAPLTEDNCRMQTNGSEMSYNVSVSLDNVDMNTQLSTTHQRLMVNSSEECMVPESKVQYAYLIAGVLTSITSIMLLLECLQSSTRTSQTKSNNDNRLERNIPIWLTTFLLILIVCVYFFNTAFLSTLIGYMMPYLVNEQHWTKESCVQLAALYMAGMAVSRFLSVFAVRFLSPAQLLWICNTIRTLAVGGLWYSASQHSNTGIWISIFIIAVGNASIFPTGLSFVENEVMKVSVKVTAIILIAVNAPGMLNPMLIGYLMQNVNVSWYIYLAFIEVSISFMSFIVLVSVVRKVVPLYHKNKESIAVVCNVESSLLTDKDNADIKP